MDDNSSTIGPFALVMVAPDRTRYHAALFEFAALAQTVGAAPPRVLSPWEAAEWGIEVVDAGFRADIAAAASELRVDAAIVRDNAHRRKRLLICDMDSTIIGCECIDELADFAGKKAEISAITERAMRGELDFEAALLERVGMLRGLPVQTLERCFAERVTLNPGARTLVATMARAGARCVLVSGGFTFFTERVAALAGFEANRANALLFENGALSGDVARPILGREAKLDALLYEAAAEGVTTADALAIGDGANDLAMIEAAGLGVAYYAKPIVAARAAASIAHTDLTTALFYQGYRRADFAQEDVNAA